MLNSLHKSINMWGWENVGCDENVCLCGNDRKDGKSKHTGKKKKKALFAFSVCFL